MVGVVLWWVGSGGYLTDGEGRPAGESMLSITANCAALGPMHFGLVYPETGAWRAGTFGKVFYRDDLLCGRDQIISTNVAGGLHSNYHCVSTCTYPHRNQRIETP